MTKLSFEVSPPDRQLIEKIAERAVEMDHRYNGASARLGYEWQMDVTAVHANGNPLRLADLLSADNFNFAHDVFGIARHIDRTDGQLLDFFSPRFSQREEAAAA